MKRCQSVNDEGQQCNRLHWHEGYHVAFHVFACFEGDDFKRRRRSVSWVDNG